MTNFVQLYRHTDFNAPPLTGRIGDLLNVINRCLVAGYGGASITITGITRSGATATATCSAQDIQKLLVGTYVTITGATGVDAALYNGTFAVATIASTTTFTYTMSGTPTGSATGSPVFTTNIPITITRSGSTASAVLQVANVTMETGNYMLISGATQTEYNGNQQITVQDSTHFTFQVSGTPATPATGSPVYAKAPLGWTRPFVNAGETIGAFRNQLISPHGQHYLRLDDSGTVTTAAAKEAIATGFETMGDLNSGTGQFPTLAQIALPGVSAIHTGVNWRKSSIADSSTREWWLIGDGRIFYLIINTDLSFTSGRNFDGFGHINAWRTGDIHACILSGTNAFNSGSTSASTGGLGYATGMGSAPSYMTGLYAARWSTGVGNSQMTFPLCHAGSSGAFGGISQFAYMTYPNPSDGSVLVTPAYLAEPTAISGSNAYGIRGRLPGLYHGMHNDLFCNSNDRIQNALGLSGVTLHCIAHAMSTVQANVLFDLFGPWTN